MKLIPRFQGTASLQLKEASPERGLTLVPLAPSRNPDSFTNKQPGIEINLPSVAIPLNISDLVCNLFSLEFFTKTIERLENKRVNDHQLLNRASEHDFKGSSFHEQCDDKSNLLILVRSKIFYKTFGGYTGSIPYPSRKGVFRESPYSFLFSVNEKRSTITKAGEESRIMMVTDQPLQRRRPSIILMSIDVHSH